MLITAYVNMGPTTNRGHNNKKDFAHTDIQ